MLNNIKIMSYNIHHGADHQERYDLNACAQVINDARPDIVAIQEIDRFWGHRSNFEDQVTRLTELTGLAYQCFGASLSKTDGDRTVHYGKAVLSRFPMVRFENHALPRVPGHESRSALEAVLKIGATDLTLFNLHLCLNVEELRATQLSTALALANARSGPVVVLGDFNAVPTEKGIHSIIYAPDSAFFDAEWRLHQRHTPTFPAEQPVDKIDYILLNNQMRERLRGWEIIKSLASDHLPILATFELV